MPLVPIAVGDLVDRVTILNLKLAHASNAEQAMELQHQAKMLETELRKISSGLPVLADLEKDIGDVNTKLWIVEDQIREAEAKHLFDDKFISLARSVYDLNDRRAALKRKIDDAAGSRFREVKTYATKAPVKKRR